MYENFPFEKRKFSLKFISHNWNKSFDYHYLNFLFKFSAKFMASHIIIMWHLCLFTAVFGAYGVTGKVATLKFVGTFIFSYTIF